jgi:hypothetical protein
MFSETEVKAEDVVLADMPKLPAHVRFRG